MKLGEKNVGGIDRAVRIVAGLFLLYTGFGTSMFSAPISYVVGLVGVVLLATGLFATCCLYSLAGMSTAKKK